MREFILETLYPSALLIDGHQQVWVTQAVNLVNEGRKLFCRGVIASKQDNAADGRVQQ